MMAPSTAPPASSSGSTHRQPTATGGGPGGLNVIALVSGGKDSFFSLLHCLANGHRVVALANLHPASVPGTSPTVPRNLQGEGEGEGEGKGDKDAAAAPGVASGGPLAILYAGVSETLVTKPGSSLSVSAEVSAETDTTLERGSTAAGGDETHGVSVLSGAVKRAAERHGEVQSGRSAEFWAGERKPRAEQGDEEEVDLNSFMYQTVGHQIIPLYAEATGIPLYRRAIVGSAVQHARDYAPAVRPRTDQEFAREHADPELGIGSLPHLTHPLLNIGGGGGSGGSGGHGDSTDQLGQSQGNHVLQEDDETESMIPLLKAVLADHPEANALCAGAILSTYQRTRVESVATRLGLVPLAYLWKYPVLPLPRSASDAGEEGSENAALTWVRAWLGLPQDGSGDAPAADENDDRQLLRDMAVAGLEARIIKVASGGLDDSFLWENIASHRAMSRVSRAMGRFGTAATGAVLGEGGEFETLVVDGPSLLFKKRIVVAGGSRDVLQEGGGSARLAIRRAVLEDKPAGEGINTREGSMLHVRIPGLFDAKFWAMLCHQYPVADQWIASIGTTDMTAGITSKWNQSSEKRMQLLTASQSHLLSWAVSADIQSAPLSPSVSIENQTQSIVDDIKSSLRERDLEASSIIGTTIILRDMRDFPAVNKVYSTLFPDPNPPSRVTISCGNLLPRGRDIAIFLDVHNHQLGGDRQGLHVQSRSYWAPANIGPYSQAIAVPLRSLLPAPMGAKGEEGEQPEHSSAGQPRLAYIAGQIPLVPATMTLAPDDLFAQDPAQRTGDGGESLPGSFDLQLVLALQHLWRVGLEMGVQWWGSAVAYVPRGIDEVGRRGPPFSSSGILTLEQKAKLVGRAWASAHLWAPASARNDEDEDEDGFSQGPDLWDRKFNPRYMSLAGGGGEDEKSAPPKLPDWSVVGGKKRDSDGSEASGSGSAPPPIPPVFMAEVDELPRQAGVEWHAHAGFSGLGRAHIGRRLPAVETSSSHAVAAAAAATSPYYRRRRGRVSSHSSSVEHTLVRLEDDGDDNDSGALLIHSVLTVQMSAQGEDEAREAAAGPPERCEDLQIPGLLDDLGAILEDSLGSLPGQEGLSPAVAATTSTTTSPTAHQPVFLYIDMSTLGSSSLSPSGTEEGGEAHEGPVLPCPVIPCFSLRDPRDGSRLAAVAVYRTLVP